MKKTIRMCNKLARCCLKTLFVIPAIFIGNAYSETHQAYVQTCLNALGVSSIPSYSCLDGVAAPDIDSTTRFGVLDMGPGGEYIDAVWLCRGIDTVNQTVGLNGLILHNISNGATCFFDSIRTGASTNAPSPGSAQGANYWLSPDDMNTVSSARCASCHTNGPFISGPKVSKLMSYYGLFNNGRDQDLSKYNIVGTAHAGWNNDIVGTSGYGGCANACHSVTSFSLGEYPLTQTVGWMAPLNSASNPTPDKAEYMWINRDRVTGSGDIEAIEYIENEYDSSLTCGNNDAVSLDARVIGEDLVYTTGPEVLEFFDIHDGLKCLNADQQDGICMDYSIRAMCNGSWTAWQDRDDPSFSGDWETFEHFPPGTFCSNPSRIQARYLASGSSIYEIIEGTPDRLVDFTPTKGLRCKNAQQPSGTCNDYTIRFQCP